MSNKPKLSDYSTHFDELSTEKHQLIVDLNAINPLSELREEWSNVDNTPSEHQLSTVADTNDNAYLRTEERGQYTAGFMCQAGMGVRIPQNPTGDSTMRQGYYEVDESNNPYNGFWFGVDVDGVFVARASSGDVEKVYQENWNRDKVSEEYNLNPSDSVLDLVDGTVFRIDFTYYGYGPIEMRVLLDDDDDDQYGNSKLQTVHTFHVANQTSTDNTNLPLRADITSGGVDNDALDLFVGGRQFSVVGKETTNLRKVAHTRTSLSTVDDTAWYPAISFKLKDGVDNIGSGHDFTHVLVEFDDFVADTDQAGYRWQIRKGVTLDSPSWENPNSHDSKPDETAFKVDTTATNAADVDGLTGVFIDGGTLAAGEKNSTSAEGEEIDGQITNGQTVTLLFQAVPTESGTISEIQWKLGEKW